MSSILEALRRSERERQLRNGKEPASLMAPHLTAPILPVPSLQISMRRRAILVGIGLLVGGGCTAGIMLLWHKPLLEMNSTDTRMLESATAAVRARAPSERVNPLEVDGRKILPLPQLDTESVNITELKQATALTNIDAYPLTAPWSESDTISPEDILPTPPLPTDPVRKPVSSHSSQKNRQHLGAVANIRTEQVDLSGVSPELALAFRSALDAEKSTQGTRRNTHLQPLPSSPKTDISKTDITRLPSLADLPAASRKMIPSLHFEVHNYVSDPKKRWVKFNGNVYRAGAKLADSVVLTRIEAGRVVLSVRGQEATLNALQDWI
ncbi:MAG: general secretion pathway protein GspB [Plesiomonas sp.]|uniref:general secretion pathway protein GspB n=1 Tax=Plesiomonas sp. TaxID=2486279 RepID=UPI003F3D9FE6